MPIVSPTVLSLANDIARDAGYRGNSIKAAKVNENAHFECSNIIGLHALKV